MPKSICLRPFDPILLAGNMFFEAFGVFILMFMGCGMLVAVIDESMKWGSLSPIQLFGIRMLWAFLIAGSIFSLVLVMMISAGEVTGGHFNPAVTFTFALLGRFPWEELPFFIFSQVLGSVLGSYVVRYCFNEIGMKHFFGTLPRGSYFESFSVEFGISFVLMFVICEVATGYRLGDSPAALAVSSTIALNTIIAGPISGGSMNPARTLGPAIVFGKYDGLWVYIFGPILGCICGALAQNLLKRLREIYNIKRA